MAGLVKQFFGFNLIVMRILGFYPPRKYNIFYKIFATSAYCLFTVSVPVLASIHLLTAEDVDTAQVSDNSFMVIQIGCFIFKLLPFINNANKIRKCIYILENPLFNQFTEKQEKLIRKCKRICRQVSWLFFGFCFFSFILWAIVPLFGDVRNFPIDIWLPFDAKLRNWTYVSTYIFISIGAGSGATSNGVIDPLVSSLAYCAASQLRILQDSLQNLGEYGNEEMSKIINNSPENISNNITTAIYMGKWYEFDLKSKKALIVFMKRSQQPMIVTAGKILDLSLVTFTTVFDHSMSTHLKI
ncbi:7tm 6 domain containing protein [Asbolus verrucosus]|uniref:7tm 6 domain containing protein n=1 Tax=Asbolus verrucosus TaxID=1661398 RepID=A0A482VCB9_ASBVE|nr:7tm 6 domain containing protein [Asbolus verrucosus]